MRTEPLTRQEAGPSGAAPNGDEMQLDKVPLQGVGGYFKSELDTILPETLSFSSVDDAVGNAFAEAVRRPGNTGTNLLQLLELRLDADRTLAM